MGSYCQLGEVATIDETDFLMRTALRFKSGHEVADHECVFEEKPPHTLISGRPVHALKSHVEVSAETAGSARGEAIDEAFGAALMVVVELAVWPVDVAMVVEQIKPTKDLLSAATH
jgi:hypothetical protein